MGVNEKLVAPPRLLALPGVPGGESEAKLPLPKAALPPPVALGAPLSTPPPVGLTTRDSSAGISEGVDSMAPLGPGATCSNSGGSSSFCSAMQDCRTAEQPLCAHPVCQEAVCEQAVARPLNDLGGVAQRLPRSPLHCWQAQMLESYVVHRSVP